MTRTGLFWTIVVTLTAAAAGMRLRSELARPAAGTSTIGTTRPAVLREPQDYVAHPVVAKGEHGRGPARIISLAPSITEIVCALGMSDRLVGRTQYCLYPPEVASVPVVGAQLDTSYERVKSLRPDLILTTSKSPEITRNLRAMGLRCEPVPHETFDEIYTAILGVGQLCDRPETARALVGAVATDLSELQLAAGRMGIPRRRVLTLLGPAPVPPQAVWVAGPGSFLDRLLELAGQENAAREVTQSPYPEIPLEKLVVLDPEAILEFRDHATPQSLSDIYASWAAVGPMQAIREHRVRTVGGQEWLSAGPRIAIEFHRFLTALADLR